MEEVVISGKPYVDHGDIRYFNVNEDGYVWHRDKTDREIEVISGQGWQFQVDGALPWLLSSGLKFTIEKNVYHRLIKGIDDLVLRIKNV